MDNIIEILKKELQKKDPKGNVPEELLLEIYSIEKKEIDSPSRNDVSKIQAMKEAVERTINNLEE